LKVGLTLLTETAGEYVGGVKGHVKVGNAKFLNIYGK
jgi:hypothetical protein